MAWNRTRLLTVVLLVILPVVATAADDSEFERKYKSKRTARMLSLGCTIVPIGLGVALMTSESERTSELGRFLIGAGAIVGPGVGQAYADRPVRFASGAVIRITSIAVGGFALVVHSLSEDPSNTFANAFFILGAGTYLTSSVYDIATVGASVDKYNREHSSPQFGVGPAYNPDDGSIGMVFTLRF